MSNYPAWAYRQQLEHKFKDQLNNPLTDQQTVRNIRRAIDEKVYEFALKQEFENDKAVRKLKEKM